ncbi:valine--tRNA ligase [Xanthobacter tagetidis]|uniref:Valine--tRNA ligase n=1 Tax=Xanthobacter tagetidis TaxID=60216 RepID=A0A3L7AMI5_9HYPH|nr:valine--tRNA ligase [Xanthobacter tagetidis]MBB6307609.1 valyl-tRNA synthetase [Xanthobacter tagetidis]RLP81175.1 valine--tRNA ligase [Xanthobacter tagetidis]
MLEKIFDPASVEARIAKAWEDEGAFRCGRPDRKDKPGFSIVIPPPNVTGSLHMGHALNNTLQDVLARFERMRGKDVLWQPGTDHAGIATQMVVERQLMAQQLPGRRDMGRAAFIEKVWAWKAESGGTIVGQLKRLGASCDWSRERFTMDEGLSRAVLKVFVQLYREGLIYKDKRLVNWDPKLVTAISDLEVQQVETKGHLWYLRYPVEGEKDTFVVVATTRPETMLGDTAVAVHTNDERYDGLVGKNVVLPLTGRRIPIVRDDYSDPEKGSGAVKITPAHDFNDFEVGRRHDLPMINVLDAEARIDVQGILDDYAERPEAYVDAPDAAGVLSHLKGMDRFAARKHIVDLLTSLELVEKIEPHPHMVPHGDRSGVVIEPWLTDQWYVDAKTLAQPALAAVRDGRTKFVPKNWEKTYFEWLENIQPWCISRQLWWGHQIPAWYDPFGNVFVAEDEDEAFEQAIAHNVGNESLSPEDAEVLIQDADRRAQFLTRDEDVLDTWFSSALWPFSTMGWPDETAELKKFYPTSVLVTGFDIIFFWVARMMMMGMHFMDDEVPFKDVYIHALVRDEKGAKMSKSKGNVIDPLDLVDQYGADALRFTLAAMAAQGRDIKLATSRVEGYRNFATKLWNAVRFAEMNGCVRKAGFDPAKVEGSLNRWIIGEAARATREVSDAILAYRFNEAAGAVYRFIWNVVCDWHLELAKPVLSGPDSPAREETRATTAYVLDVAMALLHPFMPFLTEELWAETGRAGPPRAGLLALAPWPDLAGLDAPDAEAEVGWVVDLVTEIRSVRAEMNVPAGAQIPLVLVSPGASTEIRAAEWGESIRRLARLSDIALADAVPAESVQMVVRGEVVALPLAGVVDLSAELARLRKEEARLDQEVARIDGKLANESFVARAPEEVVEAEREKRGEYLSRKEKVRAAIAQLSGAA